MLRIAIVEDNPMDAEKLEEYIGHFCGDNHINYQTETFDSGDKFLKNYTKIWNLILLDIEMPGIDGIETAKKIRELDEETFLVFVTNMAQYAIHGYEVDAFDFVVKPVQYAPFCMKMQKLLNMMKMREKKYLTVNQANGVSRVFLQEIIYVEVCNHKLFFHTERGDIEGRGSLGQLEKDLAESTFARCNSGYIVNFRNIKSIEKDMVLMSNGDRLPVSRARKKEFLHQFAMYLGGSFQ